MSIDRNREIQNLIYGKLSKPVVAIWTAANSILDDDDPGSEVRERVQDILNAAWNAVRICCEAPDLIRSGLLRAAIGMDMSNMLMVIIGNAQLVQELIAGNQPLEAKVVFIIDEAHRAVEICKEVFALLLGPDDH